jgi:TonB family protein
VPNFPRDSAAVAIQSGAPRPRPAVREERTSSPAQDAAPLAAIPQPVLGRLDSVVRAIPTATRPVGESLSIPLGATLDNSVSRATVRARLLGAVPAPTYPDGLLRSAIGGEVRVRFEVDTTGRPLMSTFAVLLSPHAKLSEAVRKVVPTMRFEPARTPWPESRRVSDEVEMSFHFTTTTK